MAPKLLTFLSREFFPPARPELLPEAEVKAMLRKVRQGEDADAVLAALESFGSSLVQDSLSRLQALDAKALSILGWTSAVAALFIARGASFDDLSSGQLFLVAVGAVAALTAVVSSYLVIRVRRFGGWPSQADWFCEDHLTDPHLLRAYHLLCWHDADSVNAMASWKKGWWLRWAQLGMIVGAVCAALGVATALFP